MEQFDRHDFSEDPEIESRLRSIRPAADREFVERLEDQLFREAPTRARHRWRPALTASLAVAALILLTLVFDLAGIGPFSDGSSVEAGNKCHTVTVKRREKQPVAQTDGSGVTFRYKTVTRHVQRCR